MMLAMRWLTVLLVVVLLTSLVLAQNWKQVHRKDDERWAKATGLDPVTVHKLWRSASQVANENDDDSRIANLDLDGLSERHDVLLVTYAGENNCLTLTVFRQLSDVKFDKVWSAEKPPNRSGFCDNNLGSAKAYAENGAVLVRVPLPGPQAGMDYTLYRYDWNGITYRLVGEKDVPAE
jgi:hypothetical protein